MNILHLRSSEFFGGPERAIVGQCREMTNYAFMCASFVRPGRSNEFLDICASTSIKTLSLPQRTVFDISPIRLLRKAVSEHCISVVVSHDYKSNLLGALALRSLPIVQIAHFRGRTDEDAKVRFYNLLDRYVLRCMDRVFVVCRSAKDQLVLQGIDAQNIRVVPNAYDCRLSLRSAAEMTPIAADRCVQIIAAGRLSREKGFDLLVSAAEFLHRAERNFHIYIYGSGPEKERLESQIAQARMDRHISLMGFTYDLGARMREAHLLVIPSRSEGMPNVLLEAWANGLAVVATPVGGIPEMIDHQINGILSDRVTARSLGAAMIDALREPQRLPAMARRGQAKLIGHFSFQKQAQLLDALYRDATRVVDVGQGTGKE